MAKKAASAKKSGRKAAAAKKESRQGRRAEGESQTSISLRAELLEWARSEATADGRSFSNYVERLLERERHQLTTATPRGRTQRR